MVPTRNLPAEQFHEPLSKFFTEPRFNLDRENLSKRPMMLANKEDEEMKNMEEKDEVGSNPNPKDWLQLGVAASHNNRKGGPIELDLFTDRLTCKVEQQMIGSFKRQRQAMLGVPHGRSSWDPVTGGDFRVVSPPRRPEAGVWLVLSAAQSQLKEPLLPQIERSYLRIKDCNMTVRLLMKYLASKLGLRNETEVEICCKGQSLPPFLMLQYVRDHIWSSKEANELPTNVIITDHVMTLNYRRRRSSE
ncbi:hypothetical protein LUZ62_068062 [Rhynchospora pubera]|uniref:Uncharacterized protein n=1 Tax=Rhynchospora pubera TaxID=906938 RepID=A0AAV8CPE7_9POAL|nr:hypothetical protein LUZ62_068062 [Rhynchospora pubera]